MPKELENLIEIARIKYLAKDLYITKVASKNSNTSKEAVVFTFEPNKFNIDIVELVKQYGTKIKVSPGVKPMITLELGKCNEREVLKKVATFLKSIDISMI